MVVMVILDGVTLRRPEVAATKTVTYVGIDGEVVLGCKRVIDRVSGWVGGGGGGWGGGGVGGWEYNVHFIKVRWLKGCEGDI